MVRHHLRFNTYIFELAIHPQALQDLENIDLRCDHYLFGINKNTAHNRLWVLLWSYDYADAVLLRGDHLEGHRMLQFRLQGHDFAGHCSGTGPSLPDHILLGCRNIYFHGADISLDEHSRTWLWDSNLQLPLVHPRYDWHYLICAYTDERKKVEKILRRINMHESKRPYRGDHLSKCT